MSAYGLHLYGRHGTSLNNVGSLYLSNCRNEMHSMLLSCEHMLNDGLKRWRMVDGYSDALSKRRLDDIGA